MVDPRGGNAETVRARHFRSPISNRSGILALCSVRRKIGTSLLFVWGRLNAHRSRTTAAFISAPQDNSVAYLPAYAPELNPEEQCNAIVKRAIVNALPQSAANLHRLARREFGRLKHRPEMIVSFFRHASLSDTGLTWRSLGTRTARDGVLGYDGYRKGLKSPHSEVAGWKLFARSSAPLTSSPRSDPTATKPKPHSM